MTDELNVLGLLWPEPHTVHAGRSAGRAGVVAFAALPRSTAVSWLVPLSPRAAAATVIGGYRDGGSARRALRSRALSMAARMGTLALLPNRVTVDLADGSDSLPRWLSSIVGQPVVVGIHLGPARANRKPVLHLVTPTGMTVGYAKIGINPLTIGLVRGEGRALQILRRARLKHLTIPSVVHAGRWQNLEVLVLSPLATRSDAPLDEVRVASAMTEVSLAFGTSRSELRSSPYWLGLRSRISALDSPYRQELLDAESAVDAVAGCSSVTLGAWHGDWTPWNMATSGSGVVVWDWERFARNVPLGFDALHLAVQRSIKGSAPHHADRATRRAVTGAVDLLGPWRLTESEAALTAALYLMEIGARYSEDRQDEAGSILGRLDTWLLPALDGILDRMNYSEPR